MTTDFEPHLISYFASLEEKGIKLDIPQKRWYAKKYELLGENIKAEYPSTIDEAFEAKIDGFIYGPYIQHARAQNRLRHLPIDPTLRVHTVWDLGFADATAIIFFCIVGREIHIIDFIEQTRRSLAEYIKDIKKMDYVYGSHLAPHDIKQHELTHGKSRYDVACGLGFSFNMVPNVSIVDGIDCVKNSFNRIYFHNSDAVLKLVEHIENYSWAYDKQLQMWGGRPLHNEHSHAADALRYLCLGLDLCLDGPQGVTEHEADQLWKTHGKKI